jgi:hypothetical protein
VSGSYPEGYDVYVQLTQSSRGIKSEPLVLSARYVGNALINWTWGIEELNPVTNLDLSLRLPWPIPGTTARTTISGEGQYSGTVTWDPHDAVFATGVEYTATVALTANTDYFFEDPSGFFHNIAGTTVDVVTTNPTSTSVTLEVDFPVTTSATYDAYIPLADYIATPVEEESPSPPSHGWDIDWNNYTLACTDLYWETREDDGGSYNWWNNSPFEDVDSTRYYVHFTLQTQNNYYPLFHYLGQGDFYHPDAAVEIVSRSYDGYEIELRLGFYLP